MNTPDPPVHEWTITTPVSRLLGAADLARTSAFYCEILGFEVLRSEQESDAIEVVSGKARIRFGAHDYAPNDWDEARPPGVAIVFFGTDNVEAIHSAIRARGGKPSDFYLYVRDADKLYAELREKGANVQGEPISQPWGLREFSVLDIEGNQIKFGQPFE